MADNITKKAADLAGKKEGHYRLEEFENRDGGKSVALVDNETGSITLQSNSGREALEKALERGNLVYLDEGVPPKADTVDVPDAPTGGNKEKSNAVNVRRMEAVRTNRARQERAGLVTDGYAALGKEESKAPEPQLKSTK